MGTIIVNFFAMTIDRNTSQRKCKLEVNGNAILQEFNNTIVA